MEGWIADPGFEGGKSRRILLPPAVLQPPPARDQPSRWRVLPNLAIHENAGEGPFLRWASCQPRRLHLSGSPPWMHMQPIQEFRESLHNRYFQVGTRKAVAARDGSGMWKDWRDIDVSQLPSHPSYPCVSHPWGRWRKSASVQVRGGNGWLVPRE